MLLLLARHGNTFDKGDKVVWVGARTDLPLTAKGREQARALGAGADAVRPADQARDCGAAPAHPRAGGDYMRGAEGPLTPPLSPRGEGTGCGQSRAQRTVRGSPLPSGRGTG